jgi:hypothetical protein
VRRWLAKVLHAPVSRRPARFGVNLSRTVGALTPHSQNFRSWWRASDTIRSKNSIILLLLLNQMLLEVRTTEDQFCLACRIQARNGDLAIPLEQFPSTETISAHT